MGTTDRRPPEVPRTPESSRDAAPRSSWVPPRIVDHGSIRHLVRAASGGFPDTKTGSFMIQIK
jgi:hypothetical protein